MTPSCCMKLSWSMDSLLHDPPVAHPHDVSELERDLARRRMPANAPVCVPVNVFFGYDLVALGDHVVDGES